MSPTVSLIVPCYNHQDYVAQTLESLVRQTYPALELILMNDGSTDGSDAVIRGLQAVLEARFQRYVYVNKQNEGVTKTLNRSIEVAQGEFVFLFASDDLAEPDAIERLVSAIEARGPQCAVVCGESDFIDSRGRRISFDAHGEPSPAPTSGVPSTFVWLHTRNRAAFEPTRDFGSYRSFLQGNYMPTGILVRRAAMLSVGLYDTQQKLEDWAMWLKLSRRFEFAFVPSVLCHYRKHSSNTSTVNRRNLEMSMLEILLAERDHCDAANLLDDWYESVASYVDPRRPQLARVALSSSRVELPRLARALIHLKQKNLRFRLMRRVRRALDS